MQIMHRLAIFFAGLISKLTISNLLEARKERKELKLFLKCLNVIEENAMPLTSVMAKHLARQKITWLPKCIPPGG